MKRARRTTGRHRAATGTGQGRNGLVLWAGGEQEKEMVCAFSWSGCWVCKGKAKAREKEGGECRGRISAPGPEALGPDCNSGWAADSGPWVRLESGTRRKFGDGESGFLGTGRLGYDGREVCISGVELPPPKVGEGGINALFHTVSGGDATFRSPKFINIYKFELEDMFFTDG